ncbi:MAG: HD domain-containing protein [Acidobacteriota bacterium]
MKDELEKCFEFILELEKLKAVTRKIKPVGQNRYETSAEHSWQAALVALVLAKFGDEGLDAGRVSRMLLVHDICEIDADDVFFFDDAARADVKEKEVVAVQRIFGILPDDIAEQFLELWNEFEHGDTPEAKYARAIDRVMPVIQNLYNNKQSWVENNVTKDQILTKTAYIRDGSPLLWEVISEKIHQAFDENL